MLGGAVVGYLGATVFFGSGLGKSIAMLGPGQLVLAGSGLVYLLIALIVALGSMFPSAGAKFLNVADRDDLDDQRSNLAGSSASVVLLALLQMVLAAAGPDGLLDNTIAIGIALATLGGALWISLVHWRRNDELMRQVSWESSGMALIVLWLVLGGWAALAVFGAAPLLDPHGVVAALFVSLLAGAFLAAGRRGMLQQR
jgi:hypothetical protein